MISRFALSFLAAAFLTVCQSCGAEPSGSGPDGGVPAKPPEQPATASADRPNVILISWDGLDRAVLKELLDGGKLPNLAALVKAGSLQDIEVKGHETETRPGHAEMLTGLSADVTGIRSNFNGGAVPAGTTVFERLKVALGREGVVTIMVTGKGYVGTLMPEEARQAIDTFDAGSRPSTVVGPLALAAIEKYKERRYLAFFHFLDPDSAGHGYGRDSAQYRNATVVCDEWLGAMVEALKKQKLEGATLFYVMADHGFDPGGRMHSNAPDSWLATNDKTVTKGGTIADVPATILARFGVDVAGLKPELLGKPLTGKPAGKEAGEKKSSEARTEPAAR